MTAVRHIGYMAMRDLRAHDQAGLEECITNGRIGGIVRDDEEAFPGLHGEVALNQALGDVCDLHLICHL